MFVGCVSIASTAQANVAQYTIAAEGDAQIALNVCSAETQLVARGDSGTDLDFDLSNPAGRTVLNDAGIDDYLSVLIRAGDDGCKTFALAVSNLGGEDNTLTLVLEPVTAASVRVEKHIIEASETRSLPFKACGERAKLSARGDGDTDLDFVVRNADGAIVHEDAALSDATSVTLSGLLSDCETFEVEVSNLGSVYNAMMLVIAPEGVAEMPFDGTLPSSRLLSTAEARDPAGSTGDGPIATDGGDAASAGPVLPDTISTDDNNRAIAIFNRSGEPLTTITWSNAATVDWGENLLAEGDSLPSGQQWNVNVFDGSDACIFDFLGETESERTIERRGVNVCEVTSVTFE